MEGMTLDKLAGGALQEKFSQAFAKVLENLTDPNTSYRGKRSIDIRLNFSQNESRDDVKCAIAVNTKLAPVQPVETSFGIFKDLRDGVITAEEYGSQLRGQTKLPSNEASKVVAMKQA